MSWPHAQMEQKAQVNASNKEEKLKTLLAPQLEKNHVAQRDGMGREEGGGFRMGRQL